MKYNKEWQNYRLIATGNGEKLEKFGNVTLLRPDPQIIWKTAYKLNRYKKIDAVYSHKLSGGGFWTQNTSNNFYVNWRNLKFELKLMGHKQTGIFPEQAVNWARMIDTIKNANRQISVLNLFGYTGGATLACISAGAKVCHVDAAKSMCVMAKNNIALSGLDQTKARFIIDDCIKFCEREIRRGNHYDAIIMDPPSYGRGPKGEIWKIEDSIFDLIKLTTSLISNKPLFYLVNSYTTGLQPTVIKNILDINFKNLSHIIDADEIGIMGEDGIVLPCGCSAFMNFLE